MKSESKGPFLGIFTAFGILYIIKVITSNSFSMLNISSTSTIISWNIYTLIGFQLIPFLAISLILKNKLKTDEKFNKYYLASVFIAFVGEIFLYVFYSLL